MREMNCDAIEQAIACSCRPFCYRHALACVLRALELYTPRNIALSFNGGKDCTAVFHLLCERARPKFVIKFKALLSFVQVNAFAFL